MIERIGIGWHIGVPSGWGTYGVNLSLQFARKGIAPALFYIATKPTLTEAQGALLTPALAEYPRWQAIAQKGAASLDFPVLHALGDKLVDAGVTSGLKGRPDIGVVFFES